jgi:hypothetical protein
MGLLKMPLLYIGDLLTSKFKTVDHYISLYNSKEIALLHHDSTMIQIDNDYRENYRKRRMK